jgi:tRNA G26 N,N-dimethylase Trm1
MVILIERQVAKMGNIDDADDEKNKKTRTVNYHKHGILRKFVNHETDEEKWVFECQHETNEYSGGGFDLIDLLDDLSKEGYELVCSRDDEYILRTKVEIEEIEEYWDDLHL